MLNLFNHNNIWVEKAVDDVYLISKDGERYLDLLSGAGCYFLWRYGDLEPARILYNSASNILSAQGFYNHSSKDRLKICLTELTGYPIVYFLLSGSESNDAAIKLSMKYHYERGNPRPKVLYTLGGLHGRTMAAAYCSPKNYNIFMPPNENFIGFKQNDIEDFKRKLTDDVGTIMLEYLPTKVVSLWEDDVIYEILSECKKRDITIIVDEVKSGFGRTGKIMASEYWTEKFGIKPDIIVFGKALSAGLPFAGILADWKFSNHLDGKWHMSSMGGQPILCDLVYYLIKPLFDPAVLNNIIEESNQFHEELIKIFPNCFHIGKWWTLLFPNDDAFQVSEKLRKKGILVYCTEKNYISLLPSLFFKEHHWKEFLAKLKEV